MKELKKQLDDLQKEHNMMMHDENVVLESIASM